MENSEIPTAKQLFDEMLSKNDECTSTEMMIEFAKIHVEAALKEASNRAYVQRMNEDTSNKTTSLIYLENGVYHTVSRKSILGSYPLSNIK